MSNEKITPQSFEAEKSTLGACLMERDAVIAVMELLTGEDFYRALHQILFAVIIALFEKNEPSDLITVAEELRKRGQLEEIGGAAYLAALIEACPSAANVESYAKVVKDKSVLRALLKAAEAVSGEVYANAFENAAQASEAAEKRFIAIGASQLGNAKPIPAMSDLIADYRKELYERALNPEKAMGLPTGFRDLDRTTSGWQDTDLIIIAARPGAGKTALLAQTLLHTAKRQTKPVVFFSLEMSREQLIKRLVATVAQVDGNAIRRNILREDDWQKLSEATGVLRSLPLFIIDTPAMTTFEMRAHLRRIQSEHGSPVLIAVDYLQLAHNAGKNENRTQEMSEVVRTFKTMARENVCPFIALSQLSRAVEMREDKRPILSDLRETGNIEQEADIVAMIYRAAYYAKAQNGSAWQGDVDNTTEVNIAKQRNGPTGTVKLLWRPEYTRFEDLAPSYGQGN